jgi:hypothetical protein
MRKRLAVLACLIAAAAALSGCSKCDWGWGPRACHSETVK